MEVKDIFELRKQGRTEEAYTAILPMYATHKGHYTTIAMFWVGVDMMQLRYQQRRLEEAYKIFQSLMRLYPTMEDKDLKGQSAMMRAAILVFEHHPSFSMISFVTMKTGQQGKVTGIQSLQRGCVLWEKCSKRLRLHQQLTLH